MSDKIDPTDVSLLEKSLNDSSGKSATLWASFVLFMGYMTLTIGSVTHKDILLDSSITFPIFGSKIPIKGLFIVYPAAFVAFHLYLMVQLRCLFEKYSHYRDIVRTKVHLAADHELLRQRLDDFMMIQIWSRRAHEPRLDGYTFALIWISFLTINVVPILLLLQVELVFLPYHDEYVSWWHRGLLLLDVALLWWLWLSQPPYNRLFAKLILMGTSAVALAFAFSVAVFPGETIYDYVHGRLTAYLLEPDAGENRYHMRKLFTNVLVLTDESLIPDKKNKMARISLRDRNLEEAILDHVNLSGADLRGVDLAGSSLVGADLRNDKFSCPSPEICTTHLEGSDLTDADLRGADAEHVHAEAANLFEADLRGAHLTGAQLQGAALTGAKLTDAHLDQAFMDGALLDSADTEGAHLTGAVLRAASLKKTRLYKAEIGDPTSLDVTGAYLDEVCVYPWLGGSCLAPHDTPCGGDADKCFWMKLQGESDGNKNRAALVEVLSELLKKHRRVFIVSGLHHNHVLEHLCEPNSSLCNPRNEFQKIVAMHNHRQ